MGWGQVAEIMGWSQATEPQYWEGITDTAELMRLDREHRGLLGVDDVWCSGTTLYGVRGGQGDYQVARERCDAARLNEARQVMTSIGPPPSQMGQSGIASQADQEQQMTRGIQGARNQEVWDVWTRRGHITDNGYGRWNDGAGNYYVTRTDFTDGEIDLIKSLETTDGGVESGQIMTKNTTTGELRPLCGEDARGLEAHLVCLDSYNLNYRPDTVDRGASEEGWYGTGAWRTAEGEYAHYKRIQSGLYRPGDHGEPTGLAATLLGVADWIPVVGTVSRGVEAVVEANAGNVHANEAVSDMELNAAIDVGGFVLAPVANAAGRAVVRAGSTIAERTIGNAVARTTESAVVEGGIEMTERGAENTGAIANHIEEGAGRSATVESRPMSGTQVVIEGGEDLLPAMTEDVLVEETTETTEHAATNGIDHTATTTAEHESGNSVQNAVRNVLVQGAVETGLGAGVSMGMTEGHYFDEDGQYYRRDHVTSRPVEPTPSDDSRTSSHTTPHQPDGHNAVENHQRNLAERVRPPVPELFGGPAAPPQHAFQMGDSNTWMIGALALGGVLIASRV